MSDDEHFLHGERIDTKECMKHRPEWFTKSVDINNYIYYMSTSTISIDYEIKNFNTNLILNIGRRFIGKRYTDPAIDLDGYITNISTAYGTTMEPETKSEKSKGRKPFTDRKESKTMHGPFKSFGTSAEIRLDIMNNIFNPATGQFDRQNTHYITKLFAGKIQIPGCRNEDHSDGIKIGNLIIAFLRDVYDVIPALPPGFERFQARLDHHKMPRFIVSSPDNIIGSTLGEVKSYSRNYTFHYVPLTRVLDDNDSQIYALNLYRFVQFYNRNPDVITKWYEAAGIKQTLLIYSPHSDTSNRRIQIIFYTPQFEHQEHSRNPWTTKAFIESSGKIGITLTNSYVHKDILWRIMHFVNNIFFLEGIIVPRINPEINGKTMARLNSMFQRKFQPEQIAEFLAEFVLSDEENDYE